MIFELTLLFISGSLSLLLKQCREVSAARGMSKSKMELLSWMNRGEQGFWGKQGKMGKTGKNGENREKWGKQGKIGENREKWGKQGKMRNMGENREQGQGQIYGVLK